ncbi:MAG TPA: sensor histidine kinase [Verrucomicrobiae bacterium]|jgi:signal transduction histidine kinase|nr:sensor histidine kinase [Verrucomicrobiae bacterium]
MIQWAKAFGGRSKTPAMLASLGFVFIVGIVDYLTGFELYFFAFYLIPVILASWFLGRWFGIFVSVLCVAASVAGDLIAGARYSSAFVLIWNALISVAFYFAVVWILVKLRLLYNQLEQRVRERTAALHNEMQERARLEEEILRIREREQQRIGHDLHDSLCQHLTATALAGQVLSEQLSQSPRQAEAANHIVKLIEEAIDLTRTLARGLYPAELKGEGLLDALGELADIIRERFKIDCQFECDGPVLPLKNEEAIHLYRIAQEATTNAVRHSRASQIIIRLETEQDLMTLTVCDDGIGLPPATTARNGIGLRIMAHRASLIGATFKAERLPERGTCVTCIVPAPAERA